MGQDNYGQLSSTRITTATTTTVKSGRALLLNVCVCGGTMGDVTIYDALTATGTPKALLEGANMSVGQNFNIIGAYYTGITVVTAAATDIVVSNK